MHYWIGALHRGADDELQTAREAFNTDYNECLSFI